MMLARAKIQELHSPACIPVSLHHLDGRQITRTDFEHDWAIWPWIMERIAIEFECEEDDVDCIEFADGQEYVHVKGARVAYIGR